MQPSIIASMHEQVRAIYRTITGSDLPDTQVSETQEELSQEDVLRSFAELQALTREVPRFAERVPAFSFTPALDVAHEGTELLVEVALPGVDRDAITIECTGRTLILSGVRPVHTSRDYTHAEIPCGPFYRALDLPFPFSGEPAVELERGILRIRLQSPLQTPQKEATTPQ